ncbi:DUF3022 domain-containing protein [Paraburkholderia sp. J12]|uniref:DUF3022 domain-containing protein n=1 Tax=Paraburkholderia sp. J12 TaxID=2805432 RepID=UPI002ABD9C9E|nr:hypothetical protein [Paraburkholderia sp. J12]
MNTFDFDQRVEEIQLALAEVFRSPKAPSVSSLDEGDTFYMQLSWVVESHRDTTLDARCSVTLRFARAQIDRYARLDTRARHEIQQRICAQVRERFEALQAPPSVEGECAIELTFADTDFDPANRRD